MPSLDFKRSDRIADLIRSEVAKIFTQEINDHRLVGLTIIRAEVSPDLKKAFIYFSDSNSFNDLDPKEIMNGLLKAKGFIRSSLSKKLNMRRIPEIIFEEDKQIFE